MSATVTPPPKPAVVLYPDSEWATEAVRAARLAARLRELGVDPDAV